MYNLNVYLYLIIISKYFFVNHLWWWKENIAWFFYPATFCCFQFHMMYNSYELSNFELKSSLQMIFFSLDYVQNRFHSSSPCILLLLLLLLPFFMRFLHGNDDLYSIYFPLRYFLPSTLLKSFISGSKFFWFFSSFIDVQVVAHSAFISKSYFVILCVCFIRIFILCSFFSADWAVCCCYWQIYAHL